MNNIQDMTNSRLEAYMKAILSEQKVLIIVIVFFVLCLIIFLAVRKNNTKTILLDCEKNIQDGFTISIKSVRLYEARGIRYYEETFSTKYDEASLINKKSDFLQLAEILEEEYKERATNYNSIDGLDFDVIYENGEIKIYSKFDLSKVNVLNHPELIVYDYSSSDIDGIRQLLESGDFECTKY